MNLAHLHLAINHIPVVGIPVAFSFLLYGYLRGNAGALRFALLVLAATAALAIPVYLTGEPAEGLVEHMPGVTEARIETHEDAAGVSLALSVLAGLLAVAALLLSRHERLFRRAVAGTMVASALAMASLAYTANVGGQIRHTEIRSGTEAAQPAEH